MVKKASLLFMMGVCLLTILCSLPMAETAEQQLAKEILEPLLRKRVKLIIALGEAADTIINAIGHTTLTHRATSMEKAVRMAFEAGEPGDTVLLSPACASFDMFDSYAHRGEAFCNAVKNLEGSRSRP